MPRTGRAAPRDVGRWPTGGTRQVGHRFYNTEKKAVDLTEVVPLLGRHAEKERQQLQQRRRLAAVCDHRLVRASTCVHRNITDPVRLLHDIRNAQRVLAKSSTSGAAGSYSEPRGQNDLSSFLESLEARPTRRRPSRPGRWWRTRDDPSEHAWPLVERWLSACATHGFRPQRRLSTRALH